MESQRVIFINIHYQVGEREKADKLARTYEKRGYSREADNQEDDEDLVIQLLKTKTKGVASQLLVPIRRQSE